MKQNVEQENRAILRELIWKTEQQHYVEDAYSAAHIEDAEDDDLITGSEQGFMLGYIS